MKKIKRLLLPAFIAMIMAINLMAQDTKPAANPPIPYQETPPKINDLIHTKLHVHFDYKKRYLTGKEWVTLKPHFYPTDTLRLDAKGMDIHNVSIVKDGKNLMLH